MRVGPGEGAWWEPATAVVLAARAGCGGPSFRGCCDVLSFFETKESASEYLRTNREVRGFPISIPDAIAAGGIVFTDLLKEP